MVLWYFQMIQEAIQVGKFPYGVTEGFIIFLFEQGV